MTPRPLPVPPLPAGRPRLVVTGFMGTGKTTAGRMAAELLDLPFFDLDAAVEERHGGPVADIFASKGEPIFRALERRVVEEAARLSGAVVATGGGAVTDRASFRRLTEGAVVAVLACEPTELAGRLGDGTGRPVLAGDVGARMADLLRARAGLYAEAGGGLDTTEKPPADVAAELASRYRRRAAPGPVRLAFPGPREPYPVVVGAGVLGTAGREVAAAFPEVRAAAVVADAAVEETAGDRVAGALEDAGIEVVARLTLPPGEPAKSVEVAAGLWTRFAEARLDRGDAVVAVGGGAALDVAGFAAATYARGLPLVNVPTTLLAMVDAAAGGKVAIDHTGVKNLVGTFHHPRLVLTDPTVLRSLPARVLRSGLAEAVKAVLLAAPLALAEIGSLDLDGPPDEPFPRIDWVIEQAVRIKAAYVGDDPEDRGPRQALNLGHTFAHAIESATGHGVPHGEAVAIGLVAACRLGEGLMVTPEGTGDRVRATLERLGLPTDPPAGMDAERVLSLMLADKKRRAGRSVVVVPAEGGAALVEGLEPEDLMGALVQGRSAGR